MQTSDCQHYKSARYDSKGLQVGYSAIAEMVKLDRESDAL
jgi:hypothetical protein